MDDVTQFFTQCLAWIGENPITCIVFIGFLFGFTLLYFALNVAVTELGISVVFLRRPIYTVPFDQIKSVDKAPLQWRITIAGFSWADRLSSGAGGRRVIQITTDPFGERTLIERKDGSLVVLTPSDRDQLLKDLNAHWSAEALPGAEAVISAEIARRAAER